MNNTITEVTTCRDCPLTSFVDEQLYRCQHPGIEKSMHYIYYNEPLPDWCPLRENSITIKLKKKMEKYKIVETRTCYSMKRGSYEVKNVYIKNIGSIEEAKEYLTTVPFIKIDKDGESGSVRAMLYPTRYEIVSQSKIKK